MEKPYSKLLYSDDSWVPLDKKASKNGGA